MIFINGFSYYSIMFDSVPGRSAVNLNDEWKLKTAIYLQSAGIL